MNNDINVEGALQRFAYSLGSFLGMMSNEEVKQRLEQEYGEDILLLEKAIHNINNTMRRDN